MNSITFGKDRYHLNGAMEEWCKEKVGPGGWTQMHEIDDWTALGNWRMHSMFGNTTFSFKNPKHLTLFLLKWSA